MTTDVVKHNPAEIALPDFGDAQFDPAPQTDRRVVYWRNGNPQMRKSGGFDYTGGWCISADNVNPDILDPKVWDLQEFTNRKGDKTFSNYVAPVIRVALLGWRVSWVARNRAEGERPAYQREYGDGLTSYVEIAAICDSIKGGVVLTAKGMNGGKLKDVYSKAVKDLAMTFKQSIPPYAFYMAIGGEVDEKGQPKFTAYGKGEEQSSIVHIVPRWALDTASLKAAQVPQDVIDKAREFQIMLKAWKVERFQEVIAAPDTEESGF